MLLELRKSNNHILNAFHTLNSSNEKQNFKSVDISKINSESILRTQEFKKKNCWRLLLFIKT